jgi:hypothetical protein
MVAATLSAGFPAKIQVTMEPDKMRARIIKADEGTSGAARRA